MRAGCKELGSEAPAGAVETFTEVSFKLNGAKSSIRPDGLIRVTPGEIHVDSARRGQDGQERAVGGSAHAYLDVAREHGFDALITISNQISPSAEKHPTTGIDGRKLRKLALHHWRWSRCLTSSSCRSEERTRRTRE